MSAVLRSACRPVKGTRVEHYIRNSSFFSRFFGYASNLYPVPEIMQELSGESNEHSSSGADVPVWFGVRDVVSMICVVYAHCSSSQTSLKSASKHPFSSPGTWQLQTNLVFCSQPAEMDWVQTLRKLDGVAKPCRRSDSIALHLKWKSSRCPMLWDQWRVWQG